MPENILRKYHNRPGELSDLMSVGRNARPGNNNPYEEGSMYHTLWENNPYSNLYYEPSFWDTIGLSNKAKDANANYEQQYNEYIASIAQMKAENEYNSSASQVERDKQAGLNPDLLGANGGEASAGIDHKGSLPPGLTGQSPAVPVLQTMGSVLSFALNAYQGIQSTLINKDKAEISNFKELTDLSKPFVTQSFAEAFLNGFTPEISVASGKDAFSSQFSRRLSNRAAKAFEHLFYSGDYALQRQGLENYNRLFSEQIKTQGAQMFSDMKDDDGKSAISSFISDMVDLGVKEYKISRKSNISMKSKQKMLDDFRMNSINKMLETYRASNGHDIMTGLILAGFLESSGLPLISNPKAYLMAGGDKASKDISTKFQQIIDWLK